MQEKNSKRKSFVTHHLRRASLKWPPRYQCLKNARIARGLYKCAGCGSVFRAKDVEVDHIDPVINPSKGFEDYNTYIVRLLCPVENFQCLCKSCHRDKTTGFKGEN